MKKREKTQFKKKIRNEKGEISTDTVEKLKRIQRNGNISHASGLEELIC